MEPTREQEQEFEKLMARTASDSTYARARAAFKLGLRLGARPVAGRSAPVDAIGGVMVCKANVQKR